ncbi:TAXI family TRAP transporter solute-binding subunit [Planctomycetota bacterium]
MASASAPRSAPTERRDRVYRTASRSRRPWHLAACLVVAVMAVGARAEEIEVRLATGIADGSYDRVGSKLTELVNRESNGLIRAVTVPSLGSVLNLELLTTGSANFAFVQADTLYRLSEQKPELARVVRSVGTVMTEAVHVVVRKDSDARTLSDVVGKRLTAGPPGSGSESTFLSLLGVCDFDRSDFEWNYRTHIDALAALTAGEIDVWAATIAPPWPLMEKALATGDLRLMPIEPQVLAGLSEKVPALRAGVIPQGTYPGLERDLKTAVLPTVLVTRADTPDLAVREVLRLLLDQRKALGQVSPSAGRLNVATTAADQPLPLHPGATAVYSRRNALRMPVEVSIGLYCTNVFNFDIKTGSFNADFYLWFRWRGQHLEGVGEGFPFEIVNGEIDHVNAHSIVRKRGWTFALYRVQATLRGNFPLHRYPFDKQTLRIEIECPTADAPIVRFVPDDRREVGGSPRISMLDASVQIADWSLLHVHQKTFLKRYPTDFGSREQKAQRGLVYSRYVYSIEVNRLLLPYVVKFVVPLVLIVLMAFSVFFIHASEFEVQAGIVITALLSCVAFHISQADSLPEVGYLVAADKFFLLSYIVIFLALAEVIAENSLFQQGRVEDAHRLDRISRWAYPIGFFGPIVYLIFGG